MAQARLSVPKIREVLRLKAEARLSDRGIACDDVLINVDDGEKVRAERIN